MSTKKIDPTIAREALSKLAELEPSDIMSHAVLRERYGLGADVLGLGETEFGWRGDAMLRGLYGSLDAGGLAWAEGDEVMFPFVTWQMMTGEMVAL